MFLIRQNGTFEFFEDLGRPQDALTIEVLAIVMTFSPLFSEIL
jgi:hypothetical protein